MRRISMSEAGGTEFDPLKSLVCAAAALIVSAIHLIPYTSPPPALATPMNSVPLRFSQSLLRDDEDAPTRLQAHRELHSVDGRTETFVVFWNNSDSVVDLWWVDYEGQEVCYASIDPGVTHTQPTYATHPWVVREHVSQNSLLVLVAGAEPEMAIVNDL